MRHNLLTKILVLVLALLVLIPNMGLGVFAAEGDGTEEGSNTPTESFDVSGSKTAEPSTGDYLDPNNLDATVTLSLPSGEYQNKIDIMFVMDNSTSIENAGYDFGPIVSKLFTDIVEKNENIELKVGVVKFRGYATDMLDGEGLVTYDADTTASTIVNAISTGIAPGSGSNIHSGLTLAEKILAADEDVEDDHKYVILVADGKSYIWNDPESDKPVQFYAQWYRNAAIQSKGIEGYPHWAQLAGIYNKENSAINYHGVPYDYSGTVYNYMDYTMQTAAANRSTSAYYTRLYNSDDPELSGNSGYEWPSYYSGFYSGKTPTPEGTVSFITPSNATTVFNSTYSIYRTYRQFVPAEGTEWENLKYFTVNPYHLKENNTLFDTENPDEDFFLLHPSGLEKGTYVAGHYWKETLDAKYNTAAIVLDPEHKNEKGADIYTQGLFLPASFDVWLKENSDFGTYIDSSDDVINLFSDIDNSIRYMVSKGTVTDVISDYFTLKVPESGNPFSMTHDGDPLTVTALDGEWFFGEKDTVSGLYPYEINYAEGTKTITWTINVPIENLKPVTLSYEVTLTENSTNSEEYPSDFYPTNKSAVLDFVSTDGKKDGSFEFEKPEVPYIRFIDIDVQKVWSDGNNQDGKRPNTLVVELLANDQSVDEGELSEETKWSFTFEDLLDSVLGEDSQGNPSLSQITYTVVEDSVDGYTPSDPSGSAEEGFVITNTHTPETIDIKIEKVWYDEDPSLRPASIKVDLLADEEPVESVELSEKTGWKATFEGMPKYSNGEEIVYDVSESGIDVKTYWPLVSPSEDGFTITNTQLFDLKIKKVWDDEDDKDGVRPEEIYVTVLGNGEPFIEEIPIGEYCEWEITLYGMPVFFDGEKVEYSVIEEEVEDYEEPEIIFEPDYGFIIKNTHKVEEPPKTDDATNQWFWAGMMVSSMALIAVIFYLKRRQDEE